MRLDYNHFDTDGCAQQVNHLLVGESSDSHLADLHQPAALPQPRLPGEAEGLHVGHDALKVDVKTELAEAVPTQSHLWRLAASGGDLEPEQIPDLFIIFNNSTSILSKRQQDVRNTLEENTWKGRDRSEKTTNKHEIEGGRLEGEWS